MPEESSAAWLEENNRRINHSSVVLRFVNEPNLTSTLHAHIDPSGRLVLSGHDMGPTVAQFWPDDEYEYWLKVEPEYIAAICSGLQDLLEGLDKTPAKDASVLELLSQSFQASIFATDSDLRAWLTGMQIPSEFSSWT